MSTTLSPLVSEFETAEQEVSYTKWLRTKVAANLADPRPAIPHDEVEQRMAERFERLRQKKNSKYDAAKFLARNGTWRPRYHHGLHRRAQHRCCRTHVASALI